MEIYAKESAIQLIQDPISVVELVAQSVSDTVEQEGIAYVTGEAPGNKKVAVGEEIIAQRGLKAELDLTPKLTP